MREARREREWEHRLIMPGCQERNRASIEPTSIKNIWEYYEKLLASNEKILNGQTLSAHSKIDSMNSHAAVK